VQAVKIGLLGATGPAGRAFATRLVHVGYETVIGSRDIERARATCDSIQEHWPDLDLSALTPATNDDAAAAEMVVIATPWDAAASTAHAVQERLSGKVVLCMSNALVKVGPELQPLVPPRGSVTAAVQATVPDALVAGAMHHVPANELGDLDHAVEGDVLVCADKDEAKEVVMEVVRRIPELRPLDAGLLSNASAIEAFTAVLLQLNIRYRTRVGVRFTGLHELT
jgi:NADPH-dependent F420 reductase